MATRYCPRCGLERREGERFCRNCGTALGTGDTSLHASPDAQPPVTAPPPGPVPVPRPAPVTAPPTTGRSHLPGPPSAPHAIPQVGATPARSIAAFKPFALVGGALLVLASVLPWISIPGLGSASAFDIPIQAIWDLDATDGPIKVGFATLAIGVLGAGSSLWPRTAWVRRLLGTIGLAIALGVALQLFRGIDQAGGSVGDLFDAIAVGVYVALVGAVAMQLSR